MLLVDHEEPTAAEDVPVDTAEGPVVDDAHGSGELGVQSGEGAYGDRGLILIFAAGDVLDGEDETLPVAVVTGGGEEPLAPGRRSSCPRRSRSTGGRRGRRGGSGSRRLWCRRLRRARPWRGLRDGGVASQELSSLRARPVTRNVGGEQALSKGLLDGVGLKAFLNQVEAGGQELVFRLQVLVPVGCLCGQENRGSSAGVTTHRRADGAPLLRGQRAQG